MGILLSDEENPYLYFGSPHSLRDIDSNKKYEAFNEGAKAQLKKVVEFIDTLEFYDDWGGRSGRNVADEIKSVILKEIE